MAINLGSGSISKMYFGATEVTKAYLGSVQIYSAAPPTNDAFEITIETTTASESFLLPLTGVTSIDVDWGDGTVDTGITSDNPTHTYTTAGTYPISVTGSATRVLFNNSGSQSKLRTVTNLGNLGWTNFYLAFSGCSNMTSFVCGDCDTSSVTDMRGMFLNCSSATTIDVSGFNTSNVTYFGRNLQGMFAGCSSVTALDVSGFDTSQALWMNAMFRFCSSVTTLDVSGFNTANCTDMGNMFDSCSLITTLDVSGFNTANVTRMDGMFQNCTALTTVDVSGFNTSNVTLMNTMFRNDTSLTSPDVSGFDTSLVTDMYYMFGNCPSITVLDVSQWNVSNVTRTAGMFLSTAVTTLDVSQWNTSSLTNMGGTFQSCTSLVDLDIDGWNVASVTNGGNFLIFANNALTTTQYDAVLIAWAAQSLQSNVNIHFGDAKYTSGGAAETARTTLVNTYGWVITDGGPVV